MNQGPLPYGRGYSNKARQECSWVLNSDILNHENRDFRTYTKGGFNFFGEQDPFREMFFQLTVYPDRIADAVNSQYARPTPEIPDFDDIDCAMGGAYRPKKTFLFRLNDVNDTFPRIEINKHDGTAAQTWRPGKNISPANLQTATAKLNYTSQMGVIGNDNELRMKNRFTDEFGTTTISDGSTDAMFDTGLRDETQEKSHPFLEMVIADENNPLVIKNTNKDVTLTFKKEDGGNPGSPLLAQQEVSIT